MEEKILDIDKRLTSLENMHKFAFVGISIIAIVLIIKK